MIRFLGSVPGERGPVTFLRIDRKGIRDLGYIPNRRSPDHGVFILATGPMSGILPHVGPELAAYFTRNAGPGTRLARVLSSIAGGSQ